MSEPPAPHFYQDGSPDGSAKELVPNQAAEAPVPKKKSNRKLLLLGGLAALILVFLAVFLPLYFTVIRKKDGSSGGSAGSSEDGGDSKSGGDKDGSSSAVPTPTPTPTTGGDGSTVTMADGTTFTYKNAFGGFWVHDSADPYRLDAQANSWSPPLNQSWDWVRNRIYGVNIGGLFVLEPFISPAIFQKYPGTEDEWDLSEAIMAANGNLDELEEHYRTFYTEKDIAEIAGAGLNWIRLPIGFWAFEVVEGEPFLQGVSWNYFLQVVEWARKYGLRVLVDLHAAPGSQNALNHSGRLNHGVNWLAGNQGILNAERTIYYLRVLTEFLSQPQYKEVIKMIGLVNEPRAATLGHDPLASFNLEAYNVLREVTGFGEGNGPYIAIQEGMRPMSMWADDLPGADRVVIDGHSYFVFNGANTARIDVAADDGLPGGTWPAQACGAWGPEYNTSRNRFGPTIGGEFSAAPNDCALFINGVGEGSNHPQCAEYQDWENYTPAMKEGIKNYVLASFDSFGDWFFWTWKIGPSAAGRVEAPLWSYSLGLQEGWMPADPREATGKCLGLGVTRVEWSGAYAPERTGGVPTPTIPAAYTAQYPWPPASISDVAGSPADLPRFTEPVPALTLPPFTPATPTATST